MAENNKIILDDIISLLNEDQRGIVKLAVTLSETLDAKDKASARAQNYLNIVKSLLKHICAETIGKSYNWKDFITGYIKDSSIIHKCCWENITSEYFKLINSLNIPTAVAVECLQPTINMYVDRLKIDYPDTYAELMKGED